MTTLQAPEVFCFSNYSVQCGAICERVV